MLVCSTKVPAAVPSGLRFIETPSTPDSAEVYGKLFLTTPPPSLTVTVSLVLFRLSPPLEAASALLNPAGMAETPANTTTAFPGLRIVPAAKLWRTAVPSEMVQPPMFAAVPPMFTNSTNSPAVLLPGSLARISLMITWAGVPAAVIVNVPLLWSVAVDAVSLTRTLAALVLVVGRVQAKLPAEAAVLLVMMFQFVPPLRVYSIRTLETLADVQVMFSVLPPTSDSL